VNIPGGRPDIILEKNETMILIESKLDAPLGMEQPEAYAQFLDSIKKNYGRIAEMILIAPETTRKSYEDEAKNRVSAIGINDLPIRSISWEEVGNAAKKAASILEGPEAIRLLDFADVISIYIGEIPRQLTENEVRLLQSHETRHSIRESILIFESLTTRIAGIDQVECGNQKGGGYYYGFYFQYASIEYWFGISLDYWIKYGESLLWIQKPGSFPIIDLETEEMLRIKSDKGGTSAPIRLSPSTPRDIQINKAIETIQTFLKKTKGNG